MHSISRAEADGGPRKRGALRPRWDATARELWLGSILIKRFRVPAPAQELILTVFEEEEWPSCIDDPLPIKDQATRWRRLKAAIRHLNASHEIVVIRFHGNGRGDGIRWEYIRIRDRPPSP